MVVRSWYLARGSPSARCRDRVRARSLTCRPVTGDLASLLAAGERAAFHGPPGAAVADLEKAVVLAQREGRRAEVTAAAWLLGVALSAGGRYGGALRVLMPLLHAGEAGDSAAETRLFAALAAATAASVQRGLGRHEQARALDQRGLGLAEGQAEATVRRVARPGQRRGRDAGRDRRAAALDRGRGAGRGARRRLVAPAGAVGLGQGRGRPARRRSRRRPRCRRRERVSRRPNEPALLGTSPKGLLFQGVAELSGGLARGAGHAAPRGHPRRGPRPRSRSSGRRARCWARWLPAARRRSQPASLAAARSAVLAIAARPAGRPARGLARPPQRQRPAREAERPSRFDGAAPNPRRQTVHVPASLCGSD